MEGKQRTIYHVLLLLVGTAAILLGGFAIIRYDELLQPAPLAPPTEVENFDHGRALQESVKRLPRCATTCIFNEITSMGCAHSDFVCMCQKIRSLDDPCAATTKRQIDFKTCMDGCTLSDQWHSPGIVLDICDAVDVKAVLPEFMDQNLRIYGRQASSRRWDMTNTARLTASKSIIYTITYTSTARTVTSRKTSTRTGDYFVTEIVLLPSSSSFGSGSSSSSSSSSSSRRKKGGFSAGAKIAVGVIIPLVLLTVGVLVRCCLAHRKKKQAAAAGGTVGDAENNNNTTTPGMAELGGKEEQLPPAYQQPEPVDRKNESVQPVVTQPERVYSSAGSPVVGGFHEVSSSQTSNYGVTSATGGVSPQYQHDPNVHRQELSGIESPRSELPYAPAQTYSPTMGRKPISPPTSQSSSPPPWEHNQGSDFTQYQPSEMASSTTGSVMPHGPGSSGGGEDLRAMEDEMARIKAKKERLHALQALEEREEQLRRTIEARKSTPGGGT